MHHTPKHSVTPKTGSLRRRVAGVAVAGAATAAATVGLSAPAHASSPWDQVAACESGGNWHINTGNGFYGGLQFTDSTWAGFGGTAYAPRADLATESQQITIAQKVLAVQGPGAWPVCGLQSGVLTRANGGAPVSSAPVARADTSNVSRSTTRVAVGSLAVDGVVGPYTTGAIQGWVGTSQDGVLGPVTTRALQHAVGVTADGVIGPVTVSALQSHIGASHTGSSHLDATTVRALQTWLNSH